jgi:DNA repair protein RadD
LKLRPYQQATLDALYAWWVAHPGIDQAPILALPTGAGKSVVIAELTRLLFDTWPEEHPRTLVIVPSKELAEQNADKLMRLLPAHLRLGYYSASVGQKRPDADVIVATIGSVAKHAHVLGNIKCVIIDECHLVNPDGAGMYRRLLADLTKYCQFRVVGLTATPFRGNGVWLTDGDDPLFTGIAHSVTMQTLLDAGHLAPLVRPSDLATRIDASGVTIASTGDYNLEALAATVDAYLDAAATEAVILATERRKWIAFTPTVDNAIRFANQLRRNGVAAQVVTGDTPKKERERLIAEFRAGRIRCLVTVLALATGFDVPDVDCIVWLRPTISPVLYIQGAGRGLRPAEGKADCLWLDFSDTTERLGPIDAIKGRKRGPKRGQQEPPFAVCGDCGAQVRPASAMVCPECGAVLREEEAKSIRSASEAAVMLHQVAAKIVTYPVDRVSYGIHKKPGSPDSLKVEYWSGMRVVAREWVCIEHSGFAGEKARGWWWKRTRADCPGTVAEALEWIDQEGGSNILEPRTLTVNETGKYPEIIRFEFEPERAVA